MPNLTPRIKKVLFLLIDIILISGAVYFAFLLRFEGQIPSRYFQNIFWLTILTLIIYLFFFYSLRLYAFFWEYVSTNELITLAKATTLSLLTLVVLAFVFRDEKAFIGLPRSTLFISYILIFIFCGGIRFAKRILLQMFPGVKKGEKERTLIVGAGDAGEQILRSILSSRNSAYLPIGFVDDSLTKQGILIHGLKVLGKISDIPKIVKEKNVESLIIALPSAGSKFIQKAVEQGRKAELQKIKIVPPISEVISGEIGLGVLRDVQIEDLLGREPVILDQKSIENFIKGKRILITGAAGSIGSELCRQITRFEPGWLFALDQDETGIFNLAEEIKDKFPKLSFHPLIADIQDKPRIEHLMRGISPSIVFHTAAYKHVPLMEMFPEEAVKNNIFGTKNIAEISLWCEVEKFIFISTDKVINPTSVMGATKRVGEMICQALDQKNNTKFISVRFGNVLDSRGSVIPIFREQIKKGGPVEVTHPEMKRYFMTNSEACLLVMQAGSMGQGGEVFVLDMGNPLSIIDLAKEMIRLSGLEADKDIPIVFTEPRPGEKFFEEILSAEEGTVATQNKKIFMAKLSAIDEEKLNANLEKLKEAADNLEKEKIKIILKELIPSYKPVRHREL